MPVVKLYANLRKLAGTRELSITGSTIGAVVNELVRQSPPVGEVVIENGALRPHIVLTLNGHNIIDFETPVTEQDVIAIFPPIAGGTSPLTHLP
ncbi:MAG: ubiquitin-like small modifier protein 1 [Anaerolineales bacterium]